MRNDDQKPISRVTAPRIRGMLAKGEKVVCLTAYDVLTGQLADEAGADVVLVGDSVGNTVLGYSTTLPVNLSDIVHHVRATRRGVRHAMLIADMPFSLSVHSARCGARGSAGRSHPIGRDGCRRVGFP